MLPSTAPPGPNTLTETLCPGVRPQILHPPLGPVIAWYCPDGSSMTMTRAPRTPSPLDLVTNTPTQDSRPVFVSSAGAATGGTDEALGGLPALGVGSSLALGTGFSLLVSSTNGAGFLLTLGATDGVGLATTDFAACSGLEACDGVVAGTAGADGFDASCWDGLPVHDTGQHHGPCRATWAPAPARPSLPSVQARSPRFAA